MTRKFSKWHPFTIFTIWSPRWHDKVVLLDADKVKKAKTDYLKIIFTKSKSLQDNDWVISSRKARQFKKPTGL